MISRWGVPDAPTHFALDPLVETWEAGRLLIRCHTSAYGATELNSGNLRKRGRFSPFLGPHGELVPFLYCADSQDAALSETVFHDIPVRGEGRAILRSQLLPMVLSTLASRKPLSFVQLHGFGLDRLQVARAELIESDADQYERTATWAQALHAWCTDSQGLVWMSRQHDSSRAFIVFGDRLQREDLVVVEAPIPLHNGVGFEMVQRAAEQAGIAILE